MQFHRFPNGSFVAHKVTIGGYSSKFSIWGDNAGNLIDCEYSGGRAVAANATKLRQIIANRCKSIHLSQGI